MPLLGRHPYDVSKTCADLLAQTYAGPTGCPWRSPAAATCTAAATSTGAASCPGTIRSVLRGERPVIRSDGSFVRDYFYVEDGAAAYLLLAEAVATARPWPARPSTSPTEARLTVLEIVRADPAR